MLIESSPGTFGVVSSSKLPFQPAQKSVFDEENPKHPVNNDQLFQANTGRLLNCNQRSMFVIQTGLLPRCGLPFRWLSRVSFLPP